MLSLLSIDILIEGFEQLQQFIQIQAGVLIEVELGEELLHVDVLVVDLYAQLIYDEASLPLQFFSDVCIFLEFPLENWVAVQILPAEAVVLFELQTPLYKAASMGRDFRLAREQQWACFYETDELEFAAGGPWHLPEQHLVKDGS